jgi:hypothetical protein
VDTVADISEVHGASIFSVEVSRVSSCIYGFWSNTSLEIRVKAGVLAGPVGTVDKEKL